jgi:two-component system, NtrC family, sensor kinase
MTPTKSPLSLRTELIANFALVAATALSLAVASVLLLYGVLDPTYAAVYISVLIAADVVVLVAYAAYQVEKVVLRPLRDVVAGAEAIASGDLARRLVPGETREMQNLATSVNRMTDRLLEEREHVVRAEKLASVGRLAAGSAHEIGNPLGAINGYVHVLGKAPPGNTAARDALTGLERESGRIDRIIRGLLDYARAKPRNSTLVDLNELARTVTDLLAAQGVLRRVQLQLSPASEPVFVAGDRHDLEQALVNLLLNAVEAMDGSGELSLILRRTTRADLLAGARRTTDAGEQPRNMPKARTARWLEASAVEDLVMVAVIDSGPGIPSANVERVFEPFFTTKEPGKGTGLGLAIVARSIENSGGIIWVSPSREGGAAFRMLFPLGATRPSRPVLRADGSVVAAGPVAVS